MSPRGIVCSAFTAAQTPTRRIHAYAEGGSGHRDFSAVLRNGVGGFVAPPHVAPVRALRRLGPHVLAGRSQTTVGGSQKRRLTPPGSEPSCGNSGREQSSSPTARRSVVVHIFGEFVRQEAPMFRQLLVPLDRSPLAEQAVGQASAIARAARAQLDLVLVHEPLPFTGFGD